VVAVWRDDDGGDAASPAALPSGARALPADDGETEWWQRGGSKKNRKVTIQSLYLIVIITLVISVWLFLLSMARCGADEPVAQW
jgi:hypothetical protein